MEVVSLDAQVRKRSKYRPTGAHPQAHLIAMLGTCRMSATDALKRAAALRLQVEEACGGRATVADWRGIFDCVNMAEQWMRMRVAAGLDVIEALQSLIESLMDRQRSTGSKALHLAEKDALRDFAADYAVLLSGVTQQQYMQAQRGVEDRIRRILSGERIPVSTRVVECIE